MSGMHSSIPFADTYTVSYIKSAGLQASKTSIIGEAFMPLRVRAALQVDMKKVNPGQEEQLKTCWATMLKYIGNIARVGLKSLRRTPVCRTPPWAACCTVRNHSLMCHFRSQLDAAESSHQ